MVIPTFLSTTFVGSFSTSWIGKLAVSPSSATVTFLPLTNSSSSVYPAGAFVSIRR